MKYLYSSILLLVLAFSPEAARADNVTGYLSEVNIDNREISRKNREVELKMVVDLSGLKMHTQHTLALVPVLVAKDGSREAAFPPVVIDGKTRSRVYLRAQNFKSVEMPPYHDGDAQVIIRRNNGKEQAYDYRASLPYERWMLDGHIELRERVSGCANCGVGESAQELSDSKEALAAYVPQYSMERMQSAHEVVKARAETRTARLQFRQNSAKIDPKFKGNGEELNTVASSIGVVEGNKDLTITGIHITGYASPEGTAEYNKRLSQSRADALAAHAQKDTRLDASLWHVTGVGEDWEGLRREVEKHPKLLKIDEVLRIIDACEGDLDACEQRIKALVPPEIYQRLLNEMYGPLRRIEYRIEYNVRNFNMEEAKRQLKNRPDLLSVDEIYKVADSYDKGSAEHREAMLVAAHTYPGNVAAVVNAARVEMERGDADAAIRLIEGSKVAAAPEALNALGVAYAKAGKYEKAGEVLRQAKAAGCKEAENNLRELERVMEDF